MPHAGGYSSWERREGLNEDGQVLIEGYDYGGKDREDELLLRQHPREMKAAERLLRDGFPPHTAVISFYDPPSRRTGQASRPLDYGGKAKRVFCAALHDIDLEVLGDYGLSFDTYFPQAPALAAFIYDAAEAGLDIFCQCEYGQSRRAACAAAIR